jgi:hypothetical protein
MVEGGGHVYIYKIVDVYMPLFFLIYSIKQPHYPPASPIVTFVYQCNVSIDYDPQKKV